MTKTKNILSVIYGLFLLIFGLNGFLNFFPLPEMTEEAGTFAGSCITDNCWYFIDCQ